MTIARRKFLAGLAAAAGAAPLMKASSPSAQGGRGRGGQQDPLAPSRPQKFTYTKPIIDAHFHWYPPEFADLIEKEGAANGVTDIKRSPDGVLTCTVPGYHPYAPHASFRRDMNDVDMMLKAMDTRRVNMCTLTQTNPHILWAPPAFGLKLAQIINDSSSALCVKYPKRFTAALTLPMQDVHASLNELERARKLPGMRAVNITENILGRNIGNKEFWPVYEAIEAANLPIFLHNVDPISERMMNQDYTMINVLGNPFEATMAAMSLVLSGAMDQFPKLDVFFPHAGGFFAFVTPRADWSMGTAEYSARGRTNSFANLKQPRVSDYRRRFHYDLIMHDPAITRMLIDLVGADRVTCGTDYPQGMGIMKPVEYVEMIPGITQKEAETILCDNPARLLRL
jgi:aminocarboxymuconate-semialdehyde decarboxylase